MGKKLLILPFWIFIFLPITFWGQCPTSVSLTSNKANSVCKDEPIEFTATPNGGSDPYIFEWRIDNVVQAGETANKFTTSSLNNGQTVSVTVVNANGTTCDITNPGSPITVNSKKTPEVEFQIPPGTICIDQEITIQASNTHGGSNPTYEWFVDGVSVQTGPNNKLIRSYSEGKTYEIKVELTSTITCYTSETAEHVESLTIAELATVSSANTDIPDACLNSPISALTFNIGGSATGANATGLPPGITGNYSNGIFTISGNPTAAGTFDYTVNTTGPCSAANLEGTITVLEDASLSSLSGETDQTICQGTPIEDIAYTIGETGTNINVTGLPNGISANVSGGNYVISGSSTIVGTHNYSITATGDCGDSETLLGSIQIDENLTPTISITSSDADDIICAGTSVTFEAFTTNGGSNPTYQWKINGGDVTNTPPYNIFTTTDLKDQDIVSVELLSSEICTTANPVFSNGIITTVNPNLVPGVSIIASDTDICPGDEVTFNLDSTSNEGTSPVYNWMVDGNNVSTGSTYTTSVLEDGQIVSVILTSSETCLETNDIESNLITMEVFSPAPENIGSITGKTEVCSSEVDLIYSISEVSNATSYNWSFPTGWTITSIDPTLSSVTVDAGSGSGDITVKAINSCGETAESTLTVTSVNGVPANSGVITSDLGGNNNICPPYSVNFSVPGAGPHTWTVPTGWDIISGAGTNNIQVNITNAAVSGTQQVSVVAQNICGDSTPSVYNNIEINTHIIADFGEDQTICSSQQSIQLTGTRSFGNATLNVTFSSTGTGLFSGSNVGGPNKTGPFNVVYTPSPEDKAAGQVELTMTVPEPKKQDNAGNNCGESTATMILNIIQDATISDPANKDQTVCINKAIDNIVFDITDAGTGAGITGLPAGLSGEYLDGVFTITGTPTEAGDFTYTITTTGDCSSQQTTASGTISVTPDNTITDASNKDQTICINQPIADMEFPVNSSVTSVNITGLPTGVSGTIIGSNFVISGTPDTAGTFSYILETVGSCETASTNGTLIIEPDVTINDPANKDQEICINSVLENIEFQISTPGSDAIVTGLPPGLDGDFDNGIFTISGTATDAGTFEYEVSTTGNCEQVSQIGTITVTPDPTAEISYSGDFCTSQGGSFDDTLTGTDDFTGGTYSATPEGLIIDADTGEITPSLSLPNTYLVRYDGPEICNPAIATTEVIIFEEPYVEISYAHPFCTSISDLQNPVFENGKGNFTGGTFYAEPGGLSIDPVTGQINPQASSPTTSPQTYDVFYRIDAANNCAEVIISTQVTITQLPQITISYPAVICNSETSVPVVISGEAGAYENGTYTSNSGLSIDQDGTINPSISVPGEYTVVYSINAGDGCEEVITSSSFTIKDQPRITTEPVNTGVCSNSPAHFEVIATGDDLSYAWYKIEDGTPILISGENESVLNFSNVTYLNDNGEYYVEVSGDNSCGTAKSETFFLNVDEDIIITEPSEDLTICENELEFVEFTFKASAGGAALNYMWMKDGVEVGENTGKIDITKTESNGEYTGILKITDPLEADSGVYWVEVTGPDYFTCPTATSKSFSFSVNKADPAPITTPITYCLNADAAPLTAETNGNNEIKWYDSNYNEIGNTVTPPTDVATTLIYYVTQTKEYPTTNGFSVGCESDYQPLEVTILDKPAPIDSQNIEFEYCFEEEITEALLVTPIEGASVNWYDTIDATETISAPIPNTAVVGVTSYWVSQTLSSTGCESDRTMVEIIINPLPVIEAAVATGYDADICLDGQTKLIATGGTTYTWYHNGIEIGTGNEITITGDAVGSSDYEVTGIDVNGCINTDKISIHVEEPTDGGTTSGSSSVCITQNQGTITLTGYTGDIIRWESSIDGTNWNSIAETSDVLNFQDITSTTSFRAVVKNGICDEKESTIISVSIDQEPVAGGLLFQPAAPANPVRVFMMCQLPKDGYIIPLEISGTYIGDIVSWQYRRTSDNTWNNLVDSNGNNVVGNSLTGQQVSDASFNDVLNLYESTLFRVEVQSGACTPNVFSDNATLSIIPAEIAPSPVEMAPGEVCLGEIVTMSASTGYGGSGTFQGGAFDNSSIANHGWRVQRYNPATDDGTTYTFESAADNTRPERWMRTNPHDYQMDNTNSPGNIIWQRFDSCSCDAGNKGFAIVSGDNPSTLETPIFNTYTMVDPMLTFDQAYNLTSDDVIRVELSLNGGDDYDIVLMEIQGPIVSGNYANFGDDHLGPPNNMEIDLSQWAGLPNLRVRWLYDGTRGGIYTIDDIGLPEDPENVQLIWYYDEDINDPNNLLEQIGEVNQSTVTYPQDGAQWPKIGWNDFEVQTALVFDTNGDPCESAENSAVASVYVFDNYTSTATSTVGECGYYDVQLSATITSAYYQAEITEFPEGEGATVAWEVIEAPAGYTFSEDHFVDIGGNSAINDPNAIFQPPVEGNYKLRWTITPNESQTTRDILGEMVTQDISANPCPMTHLDTEFVFRECSTLDFDGIDDHIVISDNYTSAKTIEAWVRPELTNGPGSGKVATIFSTENYELFLSASGAPVLIYNGKRYTSSKSLAFDDRWYHLAVIFESTEPDKATVRMLIDGIEINLPNSPASDDLGTGSQFIIGAKYNGANQEPDNYFSGWIEELRIWNKDLTEKQIRFMMNQRLDIASKGANKFVEGEVVPNLSIDGSYLIDTTSNLNLYYDKDETNPALKITPFYNLKWENLLGYYRLISANPDPDLGFINNSYGPSEGETPDLSINDNPGRLYNITTDQQNTSPTPYFSMDPIYPTYDPGKYLGIWGDKYTWARPDVWDFPNSTYDDTPIDWNIARINHDINSLSKEITMLGLLLETPGKELSINPSVPLRITHYLLLNGNIDLEGESQLLQDHGSILDNASSGWLEVNQQGRRSSYNYNYWTSPVSTRASNNNSGFKLNQVLFDGELEKDPEKVYFQNGYFVADKARTSPVTVSNEWIWDFRGGIADVYNNWQFMGSDFLQIVGAGYSMKGTDGTVAPNLFLQDYTFKGKPNNGNIPTTNLAGGANLNLGNNQNYLVGNPYPSALDAQKFMEDNLTNGRAVFNGAIYYWDHFSGSTHILEEYIGGYAVYNYSGSISSASSTDSRINNNNATSTNPNPGRYIPVAQGFFLNSAPVGSVNFSGEIIFNNTQRVYMLEAPGISIFKQNVETSSQSKSSDNKDTRTKIRLKFESPAGYHRQILVTKDSNTTNGFDLGYDAPLIENNKEDMYWYFQDKRFVIQAVPDFEKEQVLPIAIKTSKEGNFTIKIDSMENWPSGKQVYLRDLKTDSIHDIYKLGYTTNSEIGEVKDRFELVFYKEQAQEPLPPEEITDPELPVIDGIVGISYSTFSKQVKISNFDELKVNKVMIFDMGGKLIQEFEGFPSEKEIYLGLRPVRSGIYIVKVFCDQAICNKKIIVK